jgi:hypothetical protein
MSSPHQVTVTRRYASSDASRGSPSKTSFTAKAETKGSGGGVSSSTEKSLQDFFSGESPRGESTRAGASTGLEFDDDDDDEPEVTTKRVVVKSAKGVKK